MEVRLVYQCWKCQETYSLLLQIEGKPKINLQCPFCHEEGIADLSPYQNDVTEVYRHTTGDGSQKVGTKTDFPDVIPTNRI